MNTDTAKVAVGGATTLMVDGPAADVAAAAAPTEAAAAEPEPEPESGVDANGRPWQRITLEKPINRHGEKITKVIARKPIGSDCQGTNLSALHSADVVALSILLPRITEPALAKHEVLAMPIDDLGEFGGAVIGFLLTKRAKADLGLTE